MSNKETLRRLRVERVIVAFVAVGCAMEQASFAEQDESPTVAPQHVRTLRLSPPIWPEKRVVDAVLTQGVTYRQPAPRTLNFNGHEYQADAAIPALMGAFFDESRSMKDRALALRTLTRIASQLAETPYIPKLINCFERYDNRDLRLAILQTVGGSLDRRGLALLFTSLTQEQDPIFRLSAAGPLAAWNVREGVGALVKLLDSELMLSETQPLWWGVLRGLEDLNSLKDWGFPMTQVKGEVEQIEDLQERWVVYRQRWKEWFADNEHRFPDWKPGDPLPEVPVHKDQAPSDTKG